jgi:diketogulonate reductase-like aldo/keto reductase
MEGLVFGTYHLKKENLLSAVTNAWEAGIRSFDTAKLYKNEKELALIIGGLAKSTDIIQITTKIWHNTDAGGPQAVDTVANAMIASVETIRKGIGLPKAQVHVRVLLHNTSPAYMWWILGTSSS